MPRTFKATVILIIAICALALLTLINLFQTNSAQRTALDLKKQVDILNSSSERILKRLDDGVAVQGGNGSEGNSNGTNTDKYAAALNEPGNLLKAAKDLKVPADAKMGGTLRDFLSDTPKGYNWLTENSVDVANIQAMVHSGFARRDFSDPDTWVPDLAYKVVVSDDFLEYTISIREGVYWHTPTGVDYSNPKNEWLKEPHELTAEDCAFYFQLIQNPQVEAGAIKSYFEDMDRVEIVDKYTFKVIWKRRTYSSLETTISSYPLPKWLYTKDETGADLAPETMGLKFNSHWAAKYALGTGPYRFVEARAGERVVLERNPQYFGDRYPIERIEYSIVKDPEAAYLKLKADEIDVLPRLPANHYKAAILDAKPGDAPFKNGQLEHKIVDQFAFYFLGWNADGKYFSDKRVRLAMTYALNRQGIIDNVLYGLGSLQTGPFYYKHPAMDPTVKAFPFDLEKAKALLDEAGWKDTDGDGVRDKIINGEKVNFQFTITSYDKPEVKSWLSVYKEDLRKIGIMMTPQPVDWPTMQKKMDEKAFEAYTGGWGLSWSNDPYQIWHSTQADVPKGSNRIGFRNKRADAIIEQLRIEFDEAKRLELYHEFHRLLHDEQPYTFFYAPQAVTAWQPRVKNFVINTTRPQLYSLPWWIDSDAKGKKSK
jgi:peptide/nickel transport system substrate-binding protein